MELHFYKATREYARRDWIPGKGDLGSAWYWLIDKMELQKKWTNEFVIKICLLSGFRKMKMWNKCLFTGKRG